MNNHDAIDEQFQDLARRRDAEQRRRWARSPKKAARVMAEVMHAKGYGREMAANRLDGAWREAAGDALARHSAAGKLRRGVLEVVVANSTLIQELTFQKRGLVAKLAELLPEEKIRDLRFKAGQVRSGPP